MADALGMIEWKGIARALEAVDGMLKSSPVELIVASPVCPGKFIALISGELSAVKNSVNVGIATDPQNVVDSFILGTVHKSLIPALTGTGPPPNQKGALGIIETFSASSAVLAADAAAKGADINLLEIRLARGLGGKSFVLLQGDVDAVRTALSRALEELGDETIFDTVVIPSAHPALIEKLG